jgi:hypothetical protein
LGFIDGFDDEQYAQAAKRFYRPKNMKAKKKKKKAAQQPPHATNLPPVIETPP